MDNNFYTMAVILCLLASIALIIVIIKYAQSPFSFPYKYISFDVSGTRKPSVYDYIDNYLIENGMSYIDRHISQLTCWKKECATIIEKSLFKKRRMLQYDECLDENKMFVFSLTREQTRYKQENYVKHPYKVVVVIEKFSCSYDFLLDRYKQLEVINFETNLSSFHSKQQRSLMTKDLRDSIAIRDNYTCQICGKCMLDGVGLHIDHIVPIAKGGKSIPSNLQVLCSKCNGQKSNKVVDGNTVTNHLLNARTPGAFNNFLGFQRNPVYDHAYADKLQAIKEQIVLACQKQEFDMAINLISQAEKTQRKTVQNSISLHFFYQSIADILYSTRTSYTAAIEECLSVCDQDIELLSNIRFGANISISTVTRKAIILEKEKNYAKAIELCDYAIGKHYLDNQKSFAVRKARLESKLQKEKI